MTSGNSFARAARKPGFSLVEVLTAMVVLLIGILVVARLFPGGFLSIQRTGEATMAQALASQMLEAERNAISPPESIVALNFSDPNTWTIDTTARPDDLRDLPENDPNLPAGIDPYYLNNVNRFRGVIGETFRIPTASPNAVSGQYGSLYALRYGPISTAGGLDRAVTVRGLPLARTVQSSAGDDPNRPGYTDTSNGATYSYPVLRNENEYAIDYDRRDPTTGAPLPPVVAFFPRAVTTAGRARPFREFVVAFDYFVPDATTGVRVKRGQVVVSVPDVQPTPLGEDLRPIWQPLFTAASPAPTDYSLALGLRRDSDEASRRFINLTVVGNTTPVQEGGTVAFSDDPYEFAWFSRRTGPNNSASAGFLLFNPRGAQSGLSGASEPLAARADYIIFDNHILRDDRVIPDSSAMEVKLSIPYIARYGDPGDDQRAFNGLFDSDTDRGLVATPDILVYDLGTGELVTGVQVGNSGNDEYLENGGGTNGIPFKLDAQNGSLRFEPRNDAESARLRGRTVRVLYRGQKDWGTVLSKAHASYIQRTDLTGGLGYRDFYVAGTVQNDGADSPTRIYFPLSEAGKTVVLGEYNVNEGGTDPIPYSGDTFKINDNPALFSNLNGQLVTWLNVADLRKKAVRFDAARTGRAVAGIVGGSLRARVLWRDGSTRATDAANATRLRTRWRRVDSESVLFDRANR